MLNNKEMTEKFEIQLQTLYNWKNTKPKLYNYLKNADEHYDKYREMNILLEIYSKDIKTEFTAEEILFILDVKFKFNEVKDYDKFHTIFIKEVTNKITSMPDFIIGIYEKIKQLNIIEKYILYSRIIKVTEIKIDKNSKNQESLDIIKHYFREFLKD